MAEARSITDVFAAILTELDSIDLHVVEQPRTLEWIDKHDLRIPVPRFARGVVEANPQLVVGTNVSTLRREELVGPASTDGPADRRTGFARLREAREQAASPGAILEQVDDPGVLASGEADRRRRALDYEGMVGADLDPRERRLGIDPQPRGAGYAFAQDRLGRPRTADRNPLALHERANERGARARSRVWIEQAKPRPIWLHTLDLGLDEPVWTTLGVVLEPAEAPAIADLDALQRPGAQPAATAGVDDMADAAHFGQPFARKQPALARADETNPLRLPPCSPKDLAAQVMNQGIQARQRVRLEPGEDCQQRGRERAHLLVTLGDQLGQGPRRRGSDIRHRLGPRSLSLELGELGSNPVRGRSSAPGRVDVTIADQPARMTSVDDRRHVAVTTPCDSAESFRQRYIQEWFGLPARGIRGADQVGEQVIRIRGLEALEANAPAMSKIVDEPSIIRVAGLCDASELARDRSACRPLGFTGPRARNLEDVPWIKAKIDQGGTHSPKHPSHIVLWIRNSDQKRATAAGSDGFGHVTDPVTGRLLSIGKSKKVSIEAALTSTMKIMAERSRRFDEHRVTGRESTRRSMSTDEHPCDEDHDGGWLESTAELSPDGLDELARVRAIAGTLPEGAKPNPRVIAGRYTVCRRVGAGGMGVVYLVHDNRFEGEGDSGQPTRVALKLVGPQPGDHEQQQARLRIEAQALSRLRAHEHVIDVYDVDCVEDDSFFFTMPYVAGPALREWQRDRKVDEILDVYEKAALGLAAAHEQGIVHRDFKPENVLIDGKGAVKVADFGIAAALAEEIDGAPALGGRIAARLTIGGTPPYMAPEQTVGQRADTRSDQFSFCVALWEALTGEVPFAWRSLGEYGQALDEGPAGRRKIRRWWLRRVLLRGLAREPDERFASMRELIAALRRTRIWRKRLAWATGLLAVAGAAFGIGALLPRPQPTQPTTGIASCADYATRLDALWSARKDAVKDTLGGDIGDSAVATIDRMLDEWSQQLREVCVDDVLPTGGAEWTCMASWASDFEQMLSMLVTPNSFDPARVPELLESMQPITDGGCVENRVGPVDPEVLSDATLARELARFGELGKAEERIQKARKLAKSDAELALTGLVLAEVQYRSGRHDEVSASLADAKRHAQRGRPPLLLDIYALEARTLALEFERSANDDARESLGAAKALLRADPRMEFELQDTRGLLERSAGVLADEQRLDEQSRMHLEQAVEAHNRAVESYRERYPLLAARSLTNKSAALDDLGRHEEAMDALDEAKRLTDHLPARTELRLNIHFNLGEVALARVVETKDADAKLEFAAAGLRSLDFVIEHGPEAHHLQALGLAAQLETIARLEPHARTQQAREELDKPHADVSPEDLLEVRGHVADAQLRLEPPDESAMRALITELADTDAPGHESQRFNIWLSWIAYLAHTGRCDEVDATVAAMDGLRDYDPEQLHGARGACL